MNEGRARDEYLSEISQMHHRIAQLEALDAEVKRSKKNLEKVQKYSRNLIDSSPDMIIAVNKDREIIEFNEAAQNTFGYSTEEILGKNVEILYADPESGTKIHESVVKTGRFTGEIRNRRKNGEVFVSFISVSILRDMEDDRFLGVVGISRDITQRKKIEEEILRTQKLESIAVLAGGIAHDFNNILTAILGNISLARIYRDPEKIFDKLSEAEKACMRAKELAQRLVTFSCGGTPVKKSIHIEELLRESVNLALGDSEIKYEISVSDDLWSVEIDVGQISQVINNIITNAIQAMPEGGRILIKTENVIIEANTSIPLLPGKYIVISISDEGVGIPEEHLHRIFDPYFTTRNSGGGLGLAAAYSIVKNHDGHIAVDSQLGKGSTFYVYLPALSVDVKSKNDQTKESTRQIKGKILIMDDEEYIRDVAREMLTNIGCEVDVARDGAEAVELYKLAKEYGAPFDVVIMDLNVPGGMGGKEAVRKLIEIDPIVKVIVSSGYSDDPVLANYEKYGFIDMIPKPYRFEDLNIILQKMI
jgi:PAS domain S-box-containing protein